MDISTSPPEWILSPWLPWTQHTWLQLLCLMVATPGILLESPPTLVSVLLSVLSVSVLVLAFTINSRSRCWPRDRAFCLKPNSKRFIFSSFGLILRKLPKLVHFWLLS